MADINFYCPHCRQNLTASEEMAGQTIDWPGLPEKFQIPGGIIEMPKSQMTPPDRASAQPPLHPSRHQR